jgi:hypothetical protein
LPFRATAATDGVPVAGYKVFGVATAAKDRPVVVGDRNVCGAA